MPDVCRPKIVGCNYIPLRQVTDANGSGYC